MKIRVKFQKFGVLQYIGHLDLMRYFQKIMRRAEIPVAFSGGFSPHMIMSFAQPLGIGITSEAEYLDVNLSETMDVAEIHTRLDQYNVDGIVVVSVVSIPEEKKYSAMASVSAASYICSIEKTLLPYTDVELQAKTDIFLNAAEILIQKKTKRSEAIVDIKPMIYSCSLIHPSNSHEASHFEEAYHSDEAYGSYDSYNADNSYRWLMTLAHGSVENLKPTLVMDALLHECACDPAQCLVKIHRTELYTGNKDQLIPLDCYK